MQAGDFCFEIHFGVFLGRGVQEPPKAQSFIRSDRLQTVCYVRTIDLLWWVWSGISLGLVLPALQ